MPNANDAVWIEVLPSLRSFGPTLARGVSAPAEQAGRTVGDRMGAGMKTALLAGGAAIGALIAKGIANNIDTGAANDKLAAQLNLNGRAAEKAGKVAGDLFKGGYVQSADEANGALRAIQSNIGNLAKFSNKELTGMGKNALDLSEIMGEDVSRVTRGVGQLMRNDLAPNASRAFDIITRASQKLPAEMQGELLDTIEEYGSSFKELGLTGPQALGAISSAVNAGARNTDLAADALKEFSIRAVDGSKTSREGYAAIGLDADLMAQRIAAGGPSARKATSEVIQALGRMRDPVAREAAGVALFGTQYEDLGFKAISALDPLQSSLKNVGGATDEMGQRLNDNFSKRMQGWRNTAMAFVQDGLMRIADIGASAFSWAKENKTTVTVLGVAMGVLTAALVGYSVAVRITAAVTQLWAIRQAYLNGTLALNPIGLVVAALAALAVGLVVAYKKSDTFRAIVDKAWAAIQRAVSVAWNRFIKPALMALGRFVTGTLIPLVLRLWRGVILPAFRAIGAAVKFAWTRVIRPAFAALRGFLTGVIFPVIRFLWANVVRPIFKLIGFAIRVWWGGVVRPVFMALRAYLTKFVFPVIRFLYERVVRPIFSALGRTIRATWNNVIRPVFKALADFIGKTVRPAFKRGVDAIGNIWSGLKAAARRPVEFLVNTVYTNGIQRMMNKIPGVKLPNVSFARGGYTGPGAKYQPAGVVHADEFVINKEARGKIERQKPGLLEYLNNYGMVPGYATGGRVWPLPGGAASTYAGHDGVDFNKAGDLGAPFLAAASGTVSSTGYSRGYGNAVFVRGSYGELVYGHALDGSIVVSPGQGVSAGQVLGRVGSTGNSTGPHLHFGFPGGSYGAAMAFLNGASQVGGFRGKPPAVKKAENEKEGFLDAVKAIPSIARAAWSNITGMGDRFGPWGAEFKNAGISAIRSAVTYGDNKIPDKIAINNFPDIPMPDNPIRDALKTIGIFDQGGWLRPGAAAVNRSGKPEPVFSSAQWATLRSLTQTGAQVASGQHGFGPMAIDIYVEGQFEQDVAYVQDSMVRVHRAETAADRRQGVRA